MNPLCLLTKGRTFKDMEARPGAYKLLANSALPKYTAGKRLPARPSHPAPQTIQKSLFEQPPTPVKATVVEAPMIVVAPVVSVVPVAPAKPVETVISKSPFAEGAKTSKKSSVRGTWKKGVGFGKGLIQRFVFGRKGRPVHAATVQAELALEKVTVLRNDLNEDDLEVVLVERKVGTGETPLARVNKTEMPTEVWTKLTALFHKKSSESAGNLKTEAKPSSELVAQV